MGALDDFLNRLAQHVQAQQQRLDPNQNPLAFVGNAITEPARAALDTVGLGLEGTAKLGNYAAGETGLGISAIQAALGDPNHPATIAANRALQVGPAHPQEALDILRNSGDTASSWLYGALAMAMDPANLIPLPGGEAANAAKKAAGVARKAAKFGDTPAMATFLEGLASQAQEAAPEALQTVADNAAPVADDYAQAIARLTEKPDLEAIFRRYDAAKNLPDLRAGVTGAEDQLAQMTDVYKNVQGQKDAALKDVKLPFQVNGRMPKGTAQTPEFMQAADDAKTLVERVNPQGPQNRETFAEWLRPHRAAVAQAKDAQDQAIGQIRNALTDAGPSPVTPQEADLLSRPAGNAPNALSELNDQFNVQPGGPEHNVGKVDQKWLDPDPQVQAALNNDPRSPMNVANAARPVETEIDPNTGKAVLTSKDGWFQAEFDPNAVPKNPVAQEAHTVANPVTAQDGSNPLTERGYVGHMYDMIKTAMGQGWEKNKASFAQPWKKLGPQDVTSVWAGVNIETFKNLFGDSIFNRFVLANEDIAGRMMSSNEKLMSYRIATGETKPWLLMGRFGDYAERLGLSVNDPKFGAWATKNLGASMFEIEADTAAHLDEINGVQKALIGTGLQVLSPTRAVTSLVTAPGNLLMTMRHHVFHVINNVTHTSARVAAFEDAFLPLIENSAKDMLARATAEGLDVSTLVGKGLNDVTSKAGETLATDGFFNPDLVKAALGDRYAAEWKATVDYAFQQGFDRSKQVLGNYQLDGAAGKAEQAIRKFVPFMSWAWRAYPRTAKYALQHPAVTVALLHLVQADRQQAKAEGRPGYQVGTIPINGDTPLVGLLASVFTPEQESTIRVNPLALFSPLGGEALSAGMDNGPTPENVYQDATQKLGMVGASFNPLIQTTAYVTGADYKAPANASRYSPIDQEAGHVTGLAEVPTIQGPLRGLRSAVTSVLPAGKQVDNYDPVEAKAKELVFERTGKPLMDPANAAYAKEIAAKTGIYKQAEDDYLKGNALRTGVNAASPMSITATTHTTEERRAAGDPPFSYDDIKAAQDQGLVQLVKQMNAVNDQWYKDNPAGAVNKDAPKPAKGSPAVSTDPRLQKFEADPENVMLRQLAPSAYAKRLADYKHTLGIK